jgi:hypothetical protein
MAPYQAAESLRLQSVMLGGPADPTAFITPSGRPAEAGSPGYLTPRDSQTGPPTPRTPRGGPAAPGARDSYASGAPDGQSPGRRMHAEAGPRPSTPRGTQGLPAGILSPRDSTASRNPLEQAVETLGGRGTSEGSPGTLSREGPPAPPDPGVARSSVSLTSRFARLLSLRPSLAGAEGIPRDGAEGGLLLGARSASTVGSPVQRCVPPLLPGGVPASGVLFCFMLQPPLALRARQVWVGESECSLGGLGFGLEI